MEPDAPMAQAAGAVGPLSAEAAIKLATQMGLELEPNRRDPTRYKGVTYLGDKKGRSKSYWARGEGSRNAPDLGRYTTAEEAALAVAIHDRDIKKRRI